MYKKGVDGPYQSMRVPDVVFLTSYSTMDLALHQTSVSQDVNIPTGSFMHSGCVPPGFVGSNTVRSVILS